MKMKMRKTSSSGLTFLLAIFLAGLLLTSWKVGVFEGLTGAKTFAPGSSKLKKPALYNFDINAAPPAPSSEYKYGKKPTTSMFKT